MTDRQMRERDPHDYYRTEDAAIRGYFSQYPLRDDPTTYLDPGSGDGVWGKIIREVLPSITYAAGVDLQEKFAQDDYPDRSAYDTWVTSDFLSLSPPWEYPGLESGFDLIACNPPYKAAEAFFHTARRFVHKDGVIIMLLRLGFMASERRYRSMWSRGLTPTTVTVLNTRPSFTGDGHTYPGDFAIYRWQFIDGHCMDIGKLNFLIYDREGI